MTLLNDEEIKTQLMALDPEFRRICVQHGEYKQLLHELERKDHLNEAELCEEHHLKKVKLALKDQMQSMISRFSTQPV